MQEEFTSTESATMGSIISLTVNIFIAIFSIFVGYLADITNPMFALVTFTLFGLCGIYFYKKAFKHSLLR